MSRGKFREIAKIFLNFVKLAVWVGAILGEMFSRENRPGESYFG